MARRWGGKRGGTKRAIARKADRKYDWVGFLTGCDVQSFESSQGCPSIAAFSEMVDATMLEHYGDEVFVRRIIGKTWVIPGWSNIADAQQAMLRWAWQIRVYDTSVADPLGVTDDLFDVQDWTEASDRLFVREKMTYSVPTVTAGGTGVIAGTIEVPNVAVFYPARDVAVLGTDAIVSGTSVPGSGICRLCPEGGFIATEGAHTHTVDLTMNAGTSYALAAMQTLNLGWRGRRKVSEAQTVQLIVQAHNLTPAAAQPTGARVYASYRMLLEV